MQHIIHTPRKALNKAYLKVKPLRSEIEHFKKNLIVLLDGVDESESEEHNKNDLGNFLRNAFYQPKFYINTKDRTDLVIHNGNDSKSYAGVLIEAKKYSNKAEMVSQENLNQKAFHELILYYLRERISNHNLEIKHLIATNIYEWFVFDAGLFEKIFAQNKTFVKQFTDFEEGRLAGKTTDFFYREIAEPFVAGLDAEISFAWFDFRNYDKPIRNENKKDDAPLIALYKLLSPEHLLKLPFANDSNSLDRTFYAELLHIMGLTETKEGSKKLIGRKKESDRNPGSLIEGTIVQLDSLEKMPRLTKPEQYGKTAQERLFNVALELTITWINRILFLKLLEAQLIKYHKGDQSFAFLNGEKVANFDDLNSLFFSVLARKTDERIKEVSTKFANVPYLNSSLFEPTEIEHSCFFISQLKDRKLPVIATTVLKDNQGSKFKGELLTLDYIFRFLDAYDFAGEGSEEIQEENKTLINASVLGLIFEKINGYKDGSIFTPGFITMYICRETIRRAVVTKFNDAKGWKCNNLDEVYDKINDRNEANTIINNLKICDPAVGSGHLLVSALNEIIAIKSDLRILQDRDGRRLKEYHVEVVNDELVVIDEDGELFEYNPTNNESQRIQQTLFHEKQTIIENCLFGVDINPNSVKICRLRLWIELLKNAYYRGIKTLHATSLPLELETLPNIDINIKCGNSLVSRFALDTDIRQVLKKSKWNIFSYRLAVMSYRNATTKDEKRELERLITLIKSDFQTDLSLNHPLIKKRDKLRSIFYEKYHSLLLFEPESDYGNKKFNEQKLKAQQENESQIADVNKQIDDARNNKIYENAFEWRFEFPEVLNDEGDFLGFDAVIGNPPYISLSKIRELADFFKTENFKTFSKSADIYCLFYERGGQLLQQNGLLTFITSNSWLRSIYGNLLKKYFIEDLQPISLLNIEDIQVFEEATVESSIISLQKNKNKNPFMVANLSKDYVIGTPLWRYFAKNCFEFKIPETFEWTIGNETTGKLKLKIEESSKLLKDFDIVINIGILTGYNSAFIVDEETKNGLIAEEPKCQDILMPIIRGRDLKGYSYVFQGLYLINSHNGIKSKKIPGINIEKDYPGIYSHLKKFVPQVEDRYNQGDHWTNLRNCAYLEEFEKPKIVWGEISDKPKFAYDDSGLYAEATTFLMTGEKLKYLLAILNSKVSEWYFNQIGTTTGMGTNRWKKYKIELLPVKVPSADQEQQLEILVNQILMLKKANPNANTTDLENEIDRLVYELYDLTNEEIQIVEGTNI